MTLYDSHCHLDVAEFDADREAVLARARDAGVTRMLVPAIDRAGWPKLQAVCAGAPGLRPAYGLHPVFLDRHGPDDLGALERWLEDAPAAAVGECGLDHFVAGLDPEAQRRCFEGQLAIARAHRLPVVVHARRAVDAVIAAIRRAGGVRGVVHSWSGSDEQARQLFDLGFSLGIGGPVTFERATRLRRTVATMPLDRLLLETDAPDQPDASRRGTRNEPAFLPTVAAEIARLRAVDVDTVVAATTANAVRLFG